MAGGDDGRGQAYRIHGVGRTFRSMRARWRSATLVMGLSLVPCHAFPADAQATFLSIHALKDPKLAEHLSAFIAAGKPLLVTDGLAAALAGQVKLDAPHVRVLSVKGAPQSLLTLPQAELAAIRQLLLRPLHRRFEAPHRAALYLFEDGSYVIENFNDERVTATLDGTAHELGPRAWACHWK